MSTTKHLWCAIEHKREKREKEGKRTPYGIIRQLGQLDSLPFYGIYANNPYIEFAPWDFPLFRIEGEERIEKKKNNAIKVDLFARLANTASGTGNPAATVNRI